MWKKAILNCLHLCLKWQSAQWSPGNLQNAWMCHDFIIAGTVLLLFIEKKMPRKSWTWWGHTPVYLKNLPQFSIVYMMNRFHVNLRLLKYKTVDHRWSQMWWRTKIKSYTRGAAVCVTAVNVVNWILTPYIFVPR